MNETKIQTQVCCVYNTLSEPVCCTQIFAASVSQDI